MIYFYILLNESCQNPLDPRIEKNIWWSTSSYYLLLKNYIWRINSFRQKFKLSEIIIYTCDNLIYNLISDAEKIGKKIQWSIYAYLI